MSAQEDIGPVGEMPGWKVYQLAGELRALATSAAFYACPGPRKDLGAARKALAQMQAILGSEKSNG